MMDRGRIIYGIQQTQGVLIALMGSRLQGRIRLNLGREFPGFNLALNPIVDCAAADTASLLPEISMDLRNLPILPPHL